MEFFSADQPGKVRGPRRDILFLNEGNNVSYETYTQLEVRTKKFILIDWNPVREFWWYTEVEPKQDVDFVTLTYKDNESLTPEFIKALEVRMGNKAWWRVYGEGLLGELEGQIYRDWEIIDEIPHEARLMGYGLDFGYTNDESAIVADYEYNGGHIWDEIAYQKGLSNRQIAQIILNCPKALTVADSAEPKSIDEIKGYGVNIIPSVKGQGSVNQGIQYVQEQRISVTKRSLNIIKEQRNYMWLMDKDGKIINTPSPIFNHAMDAGRYITASGKKPITFKFTDPGGVRPYIPGLLA